MSGGCCGSDAKFDGVSNEFKRALWAVIAINGAMFSIEMAAGAFAGSKALQADALDFLGDTVTYALSLYVIGMSLRVRATAALIKGLSLGAMGLWVFSSTAYQVLVLGVPSAEMFSKRHLPVTGLIIWARRRKTLIRLFNGSFKTFTTSETQKSEEGSRPQRRS